MIFLIEHLTHQKGPEQLSADHSALIDFNQLISDKDLKNLGTVVQELQLTDFDETTIILTGMTSRRASGFLFFRVSLPSGFMTNKLTVKMSKIQYF